MKLVGKQKIAALLLNLDKNEAARVLQSFREGQILAIAEAMREISEMDIPKEELSRIYDDFKRSMRVRAGIFKPRPEQVEELFAASLGEGKTDDLFSELDERIVPESPFKPLTRFQVEHEDFSLQLLLELLGNRRRHERPRSPIAKQTRPESAG